jgi:hypothetical protein
MIFNSFNFLLRYSYNLIYIRLMVASYLSVYKKLEHYNVVLFPLYKKLWNDD